MLLGAVAIKVAALHNTLARFQTPLTGPENRGVSSSHRRREQMNRRIICGPVETSAGFASKQFERQMSKQIISVPATGQMDWGRDRVLKIVDHLVLTVSLHFSRRVTV